MDLLEVVKGALQWVVAPLVGWAWYLHEKINAQNTRVAVLEAELNAQKTLNAQTYTELRSSFNTIVTKLDSIEQFLRK